VKKKNFKRGSAMKWSYRGLIIVILSCFLLTASHADTSPESWHGNKLVKTLKLDALWKTGILELSQSNLVRINAFKTDLATLTKMNFRIPVTLLITVDEPDTKTVILNSEEMGYTVVLRFHSDDRHFEVVWFDRLDVEISNDQGTLTKD
jgi:hypothetical protein